MKNLQIKKSNQLVTLLSLSFLMLSLIITQPSFAKTTLTKETVYYQGEWITRVHMPEVMIKANRINKGKVFLKNVETVYQNGLKTIHVTIEDVMISSVNKSKLTACISNQKENNFESNLSINPNTSNITASNNIDNIIIQERNNTPSNVVENNVEVKMNSGEKIKTVKKPVLNHIVNSLVEAGINFLKKVNDGLFFRS